MLDRAPGRVGGPGEVDGHGLVPHVLPLLVGHLGDRVPHVDPGVVDQDVQPAQVGSGLVHHLPDGGGIGQVRADDRVPLAGQAGQHLEGQRGRIAVMHRHPVALAGERLRHRPADAPRRPGDQDRAAFPGRHFSSHRASSLVAVDQFLAVAVMPFLAGTPRTRSTTWASSLVPKPSGVCRNRAGPIAVTVSALPLAAAALCAALIRSSTSGGGSAFRNTTCTSLGFGSSGWGLVSRTRARSSRDRTTTGDRTPNASAIAASRAAASLAVSSWEVVNSTLPLWI